MFYILVHNVVKVSFRDITIWIFSLDICIELKHFVIQQMHKYVIRRYNYIILAQHYIELPDDGSLVIRNRLEQF